MWIVTWFEIRRRVKPIENYGSFAIRHSIHKYPRLSRFFCVWFTARVSHTVWQNFRKVLNTLSLAHKRGLACITAYKYSGVISKNFACFTCSGNRVVSRIIRLTKTYRAVLFVMSLLFTETVFLLKLFQCVPTNFDKHFLHVAKR
jgi:hypothetical protein